MQISTKTVLMLALYVMVTSQRANGCQCPSCNYANAAQNCQCCIYRQLGKRSDPASTFDLPVPSDPTNSFRYKASANRVPQRRASMDRVDADDWSARARDNYFYDAAEQAEPMTSGLDDVNAPRPLKEVVARFGRYGQKSTLSRLLENIRLAMALQSAESSSQY